MNLADNTDLLIVQVLPTSGNELPFTVTAPDGNAVTCSATTNGQIPQCATSASGNYTVVVNNQNVSYTISYMPLLSDATCGTINPSFASAPLDGSLSSGSVGSCYTLNVPSGHTVFGNLDNASTQSVEILLTIYDSTGTQVCFDSFGTCTLTGAGPYRVLVDQGLGVAAGYAFELDDLTNPTGCVSADQGTYGTAPSDSSTNACRELTVTTPDEYQVFSASSLSDVVAQGTLYTATGTVACTNSGPFCRLSVGTYYYVEDQYILAPYDFVVTFIATDASSGCAATGDTDFATGPATANFDGIGEVDCLNLPTAAGQPVYVYDENVADNVNSQAPLLVVDATGAQQCTNLYDDGGVCAPTGTAPFRILAASQQRVNTGYKILVQATDSTAGCSTWPQSGFGGSWGATVTTSFTSNVACLTIPGTDHSTAEMIAYADTTNTEDGGISINDSTGTSLCLVGPPRTCDYQPGVAYTAIVSSTGQSETYELVRRDATQSASCRAPASTTVGGPSTAFSLTSAIDANCYRVTTTDATDDMWFNIRATAPYPASAYLLVTNSTGTPVCLSTASRCEVSGSTDYQVITVAYNYAGTTIAGHLDTWQMTTPAGPVTQCAANPLSVDGWAPISGTLTESDTAYCATIPYQAGQEFDLYSTSSNGSPLINVFPFSTWNSMVYLSAGICASAFGSPLCAAPDTAGTAVLLVTLDGAQSPMSYTIQGACYYGCSTRPGPATISGISPNAQPAGATNKVTVTGTNLNLGTEVMLATTGNPVSTTWISTPISTNAAGTEVTVELNTSDITPGTYDVMLNANYSEPTTSPGYLAGAYTVKPAA